MLVDFAVLPFALWTAISLRLGEWLPDVQQFWPAFVVSALVCIPVFGGLGLYRHVVRHWGNHAMLAVVKGATITAIAVATVAYMVPLTGFPRSVPIIFWLLILLYVSGSRFAVRAYFQHQQRKLNLHRSVIVYGAGAKGVELAQLLLKQGNYTPVAFVDDAESLHGRILKGLYVYSPEDLQSLIEETGATQIFIAVDSTAAEDRRRIIEYLEAFELRVRLIPDLIELVSGRQDLTNIRDVEVDDVLGRNEVDPLPHLLAGSVKERNVMVTGAGGSIGSELCRQIMHQHPAKIVLLDQSEFGLFQIYRELRGLAESENISTSIVAVLGSVTNSALLRQTLKVHPIDTLYHAAAYKHVGLVEQNVIQGLKNNTFGTLHAAEAAMDNQVRDFVLISTDKAVRTTSVMGASKRLAEMTLQALQETSEYTRFSMVRFGNVLGSSGSVVPLFLDQIANGGPVTVTHPDVTRFFMTIPEAAQLVLQAASMARGGDVFLLDMGQPVKIMDLAQRMIRIKGYKVKDEDHPHGDIEIQISGLNPGEKLHEELLLGESVSGTEHRKIMRAEEVFIPWTELRGALHTLEQACDAFDYEAIKRFVAGLVEGSDLASQLIELRTDTQDAQIVPLKPRPGDFKRD